MRKSLLILVVMMIVALNACAVKDKPSREVVADEILPSPAASCQLDVSLPDDALPVWSENGQALYDQGAYQILQETFSAASAQEGMAALTGFDPSLLRPIAVEGYPHEKYYLSWTSAGESGCECCYAVVMYDGQTCYSLQIRCPEAVGAAYHGAFQTILSHARLTSV